MMNITQHILNSSLEFSLMGVAILSLVFSLFKHNPASKTFNNFLVGVIGFSIFATFATYSYLTNINVINITLLITSLCILQFHAEHTLSKLSSFSVFFLTICSIIGTLFAIKANNFLSLYLAFETISFTGYIMVSLLTKNPLTSESAIKYFIIGSISSVIMLFGISFIYGGSNSIAFNEIASNQLATFGILLFLCGIFFKLTAFPFHFWAPDVYSTTSLPTLSVIAILPKIAGLFSLANILPYASHSILVAVISFVAIASMLIGSVGAIFQNNINRIIAYSGIANIGFILTIYTTQQFSKATLVEFIIIYTSSLLLVICTLLAIRKNTSHQLTIQSMQGLYKTNPTLSAILSIALLNLAGIPPLAGFFAKYIIIKNLITQQNFHMPIIIVTASAIALFYYLKIIKWIFLSPPSEIITTLPKSSLATKITTTILLVFVITYFSFQTSPIYQNLIQQYTS